MDVKTRLDLERYNYVVGGSLTDGMFKNIKKSIKILLSSNIPYEFRTTLVKELHDKNDVLEICKVIKGSRVFYLQNFRKMDGNVAGKNFTPFGEEEMEEVISEARELLNIVYRR